MEGPPALSSFRRHVSKGLLPLLPSGGAVGEGGDLCRVFFNHINSYSSVPDTYLRIN